VLTRRGTGDEVTRRIIFLRAPPGHTNSSISRASTQGEVHVHIDRHGVSGTRVAVHSLVVTEHG
jgi:hypothetical protein